MAAQLERMRLEAAEAKRQLQVVEVDIYRPFMLWAFARWRKTSLAVGSTMPLPGLLQRVRASGGAGGAGGCSAFRAGAGGGVG